MSTSPTSQGWSLISYTQGILHMRGRTTVKVVKVKGPATDEMVGNGQARQQDKDGNEAADLGRRRQPEHIMETGKKMQQACNYW